MNELNGGAAMRTNQDTEHECSASATRQRELAQNPLSYAQERLWFLDQLEPGSSTYNTSRAFRLFGTIDVDALQAAISAVAARHDVIRSTYTAQNGVPVQTVASPTPIKLKKIDLGSYEEEEDRERRLQELIGEEFSLPFDLTSDVMLRATLFHLSPATHLLLLVMHHIATDGWSMNILLHETAVFYNAFAQGKEPSLPPLPLQYSEYAERQRTHFDRNLFERDYAYWRRQLAGTPAQLAIPQDRTRMPSPSYDGESLSSHIPSSTTKLLRELARQNGATPFMVLLAVYFVVLHRYTDQDDLCVGIPIAGRTDLDVEPLIGVFVNMLVIREQISGASPFLEFLGSVRNTCLDAYDHQTLPFERLVALLQPQRIRNRTPLFQVSFSLQPQPTATVELHELAAKHADVEVNSAKFDLSLVIRESDDEFGVDLTYPTQLFERASIQRMLDQYVHACADICADPTRDLDGIQLAPAIDPPRVPTSAAPPSPRAQSIPAAFDSVATKSPQAIALQMGDLRMTYGELHQASDQLASFLLESGTPRGAKIGIFLEASFDSVICALATLKSGAGYVPLDPSLPARRTAQLIAEANLHLVLTATSLLQDLPSDGPRRVCLETMSPIGHLTPGSRTVFPDIQSDDLAYVIFTSGSTGRPKGVLIPHRGVLRLVTEPNYVTLNQTSRLLHLASPTFDASTFEIWGPLLNGGVCVLSSERVPSISQLANLIRENGINTLWLTSSWFNTIVDEDVEILAPVRQLLIGGERLSVPHVIRALQMLPDTHLINGYGPTENTTFSCCYSIPRTLDPNSYSVPIGRPVQGDVAAILDARLQPTAPGVPGELCVGGDGLALGYLNDDMLTAEQFIPNPLHPNSGDLVYRTGDRVRLLPSGNLEFLGRMDRQLKIRGYRVEPGEIEHVVMQHPSISRAHIAVHGTIDTVPMELVAYVVPVKDARLAADELRQFLSMQLPDYMVPSCFIPLASLPRDASGKIDESSLPDPATMKTTGSGLFVKPTTGTERRIAEVWKTILPHEQVGIEDSFFDIGGHSLLAVRLVAQLETLFNVSLPLAVLFDAPTIKTLASRIENLNVTSQQRSTVLPLRKIPQTAPPFVCVPPGGSTIYHFSDLARYLPAAVSIYGTQPLGVERGETPQPSVEEMAARYVEDLRQLQPEGPYYLGGRCFGAFVAFEMAQQLVRQGGEVGLLVLMDPSGPPGLPRDAKYYARRVAYFKRRGQLARAAVRHIRARVRHVWRLWLRSIFATSQQRRMARMQRVHRHAQFTYKPKPYSGNLIFLGAQDDYDPEDTRALWQLLVQGEFTLRLVLGDHRTMTQEPLIRTFAEDLGQIVLEAQQRNHISNHRLQS